MSSIDAPLLVIHEVGDPAAGRAWRDAFASAGWAGPVHAPDLPGHGTQPAPLGGNYELGDALFFLLPVLRDLADGPAPVVVGVGSNGWPAQLVAVAGRASALVLVDGVGGPWKSAAELIAEGRERVRALADDPAAMGPAPRSGLDPRLAHGYPRMASRTTVARVLGEITVPMLVVETAASPLDPGDADALVFGAGGTGRRLTFAERLDPASVAETAAAWIGDLTPAR